LPPPVGPFPDLPGLTRIALVRDPEPGSLERSPIAQALRGSVGRGELASWGAAYTSIDGALAGLADALASGSRLVAAPANLLVARSTRRLGAQLTRGGAGLVAQDPFSSGRLDGRLFEETRWAIGPSELPRNLTSLQESLGPVTRLGFLSEGRRRTLPQAALRFLLDLPAVVTIAWDFLTPRILADSEALDAVPSLSEAEIARVDAVTGTGT
ncbi:MAG TPA: hypothetical protein VLY85_00120, partial [Thermoplasmata archaeon]|nr:hypothetical protein [Thermoplasmata archaeon]